MARRSQELLLRSNNVGAVLLRPGRRPRPAYTPQVLFRERCALEAPCVNERHDQGREKPQPRTGGTLRRGANQAEAAARPGRPPEWSRARSCRARGACRPSPARPPARWLPRRAARLRSWPGPRLQPAGRRPTLAFRRRGRRSRTRPRPPASPAIRRAPPGRVPSRGALRASALPKAALAFPPIIHGEPPVPATRRRRACTPCAALAAHPRGNQRPADPHRNELRTDSISTMCSCPSWPAASSHPSSMYMRSWIGHITVRRMKGTPPAAGRRPGAHQLERQATTVRGRPGHGQPLVRPSAAQRSARPRLVRANPTARAVHCVLQAVSEFAR